MTDTSEAAHATLPSRGAHGEWQRISVEFQTFWRQPSGLTHRVSLLASANKTVVSITPAATVEEAFTLMLNHNYSQLPVLDSDKGVKGIFSWRSYGKQVARGRDSKLVKQAIEPAAIIDVNESIFEAFAMVTKNDYVLVRNGDRGISGIVTTFDISELFANLAEPFLLVEEIEKRVRALLTDHVTLEQIKTVHDRRDSKRSVLNLSDLTFGAYVKLFDTKEVWERLKLRLGQQLFVGLLDNVREIRNEVMHFRPKAIEGRKLEELRNFTKMLRDLSPIEDD